VLVVIFDYLISNLMKGSVDSIYSPTSSLLVLRSICRFDVAILEDSIITVFYNRLICCFSSFSGCLLLFPSFIFFRSVFACISDLPLDFRLS